MLIPTVNSLCPFHHMIEPIHREIANYLYAGDIHFTAP